MMFTEHTLWCKLIKPKDVMISKDFKSVAKGTAIWILKKKNTFLKARNIKLKFIWKKKKKMRLLSKTSYKDATYTNKEVFIVACIIHLHVHSTRIYAKKAF